MHHSHADGQVDSQLEVGREAGGGQVQSPRAARDISAPLNSIMTLSSTSHRLVHVKSVQRKIITVLLKRQNLQRVQGKQGAAEN